MAELPYIWSQGRDDVLISILRLLSSRNVATSRKDCLELVMHFPEIFDELLIIITHIDRSSYHPETIADAVALKILMFLLQCPRAWLPEFSYTRLPVPETRFPSGITSENEEIKTEWTASVKLWKMFIQTPTWESNFLRKWNKIEQENILEIIVYVTLIVPCPLEVDVLCSSKLRRRREESLIEFEPLSIALAKIIEERGRMRICILRILFNLTYGEDIEHPLLSTNSLFPFLIIAYSASQKIPGERKAALSGRHAEGPGRRIAYLRQERLSEIILTSAPNVPNATPIVCLRVLAENITGPLLLLRLLQRIYETYGPDIASCDSLPPNTLPHDHLGRIHQITSNVIAILVLRNVVGRRIICERDSVLAELQAASPPSADILSGSLLYLAELALQVIRLHECSGSQGQEWTGIYFSALEEFVSLFKFITLIMAESKDWSRLWWFGEQTLHILKHSDPAVKERLGPFWEENARAGIKAAEAKLSNLEVWKR